MKKVFSIRDGKAEAYNQPWFALTPGEAERSFKRLVNDPQSTIYSFPEDYDLFLIGEFCERTGKIKGLDTPQHVVKAVNLKEKGLQPVQ